MKEQEKTPHARLNEIVNTWREDPIYDLEALAGKVPGLADDEETRQRLRVIQARFQHGDEMEGLSDMLKDDAKHAETVAALKRRQAAACEAAALHSQQKGWSAVTDLVDSMGMEG